MSLEVIIVMSAVLLLGALCLQQTSSQYIHAQPIERISSDAPPEKSEVPKNPPGVKIFRVQLNWIEILNTHNDNEPGNWKMWLKVWQNVSYWGGLYPQSKIIEIDKPDGILSHVNKGQKIDFSGNKVYLDIYLGQGCCPSKVGKAFKEHTFLVVITRGTDVLQSEKLGEVWKPYGVLSTYGVGTHTALSSTGDYKINFTIKMQ